VLLGLHLYQVADAVIEALKSIGKLWLRSWCRPPLLLLCHAKAPNYRKKKAFKDLAYYSEWPKVADAVIKARALYSGTLKAVQVALVELIASLK